MSMGANLKFGLYLYMYNINVFILYMGDILKTRPC